jgi:hypothetical protein
LSVVWPRTIGQHLWGSPPGLRGSPWTRRSPINSALSKPSKPTRASAADQGVRPTLDPNCAISGKLSGIAQECVRHEVNPPLTHGLGGEGARPSRRLRSLSHRAVQIFSRLLSSLIRISDVGREPVDWYKWADEREICIPSLGCGLHFAGPNSG